MSSSQSELSISNTYETLFNSLKQQYGIGIAVTRAQFREILDISRRTDCRMYNEGNYPRTISVRGEERILITDLIKYLLDLPSGKTLVRRGRKKEEASEEVLANTNTNKTTSRKLACCA